MNWFIVMMTMLVLTILTMMLAMWTGRLLPLVYVMLVLFWVSFGLQVNAMVTT